MKLNKLAQCLALVGLSAHVAGVLAQTTPEKLQRIEITGSSIKRIQDAGALPVQVITREDIERAGISTAEQLIASLNINGNGMDNLASNADVVAGSSRGNNGASSANLRGQGASSTLILLNGRRVAAHGLNGGAVDLNSIPFAAVERVEVLKDGASAIYGTDAIGGVINFILKRSFTGLQASASVDATEAGGGNIYRTSVVGGFGDIDKNGFNLLATLAVSDNKLLRGDQRAFVNTFQPDRGLSVDTRGTPFASVFPVTQLDTILSRKSSTGPIQPGTTQQMGGGINVLDLPGQAGCASMAGGGPYDEVLWQTPTAKWACAWDTGRAASLQQPVKNTNLVTRGSMKLGEHVLSAEVVLGRSESAKSFSPVQITTSGLASSATYNVTYPNTGPSYDYVFNEIAKVFPSIAANKGLPIAFRWRCMDCGNRELATQTDTGRYLVSAEGPIGSWDYKAGLSSAFSKSESQAGTGYQYQTDLMNLIKTGVLNPFLLPGQTQTPAALAGLAAASANGVKLYGGEYQLKQADASASGTLFKVPAGDAMGAVGVDLRRETFIFSGDSRTDRRNIFLLPFDNQNTLADKVTRDVKAVYGELLLPITRELELSAAVRRDDYTGFGATTNPKVSLRYAPIKQLVLRGSYTTGFRVPTFNQMFNGLTESAYSGKDIVDPAKCAALKVDASKPGCESITPVIYTGGRQDLGPENAKQGGLGLVWSPSDSFVGSVDWWTINRTGTIQDLTLTQLVNNYSLFQGRFLRDASGNVAFIDDRPINAGESVTSGLELSGRYNTKAGAGRIAAGIDISYLLAKKSRLLTGVPFGPSEIDRFTRSGDLGLRWKHSAFFTYSQGPWSSTVTQIYRGGYTDYVLPGVANGAVTPPNWNPKVAEYMTFNLSVSYTGIKNLSLTAGIKNVLNQDPPFSAAYDTNTGAGSSWEPRVADPRGRSYLFGATYSFF